MNDKNKTYIFLFYFFSEEPLVIRLTLIALCHFRSKIVITIKTVQTVPWFIKAPGGTAVVTTPT